jgi:hypothetical protein
VTLETIMIGAKGFRAREATANYKRRVRRLVSDEVRASRFANLHGMVETKAVAPAKPEVTEETKVEQVAEQNEAGADEDAGQTGGDAEGSADEADAEGDADRTAKIASKKKAGKAKK